MGSYRTAKVDETFYDVFTVFDFDGVSTVSGQLPGDFTVTFSRDDQEVTGITYTISEIGTTGTYALVVPDGFPSKGMWAPTVFVDYNGSAWRSHVEVRAHDIDDVYDVIVAGGSGVEQVTLTVVDTANGDAPIPDALIQVYDDTGVVLVTFQRTDTSGEAVILLDPDTYIVRVYTPGVSCSDHTIVVADTGGLTPQAFQIDCESITVAPPPAPNLCRLFGDFVKMNGMALEGLKVRVENLFDPEADAGLNMLEPYQEYETDVAGHVEFDVVRGSRVRVAFVGSNLSRDITVPDTPVANLTTVFGQAADNFTVA